ncbi:MAG: hypothetical protein BWY82_00190 [Verrucomicrobia bacterium ADurb.Bin474]|nr:MAG: hypothetical protein BWY82_00190 [Verrucomicrobia bacterium ADurb.Bin474]
MDPPQEIVVELFTTRLLEAEHLTTLRINTRKNMPDEPVFSGRIHPLENKEHRVPVIRIKLLLNLG